MSPFGRSSASFSLKDDPAAGLAVTRSNTAVFFWLICQTIVIYIVYQLIGTF